MENYGTLEINLAAFRRDGRVLSQTPIGFNCDNGALVCLDDSNGKFHAAGNKDAVGIVYTAEKEYERPFTVGLDKFTNHEGDYVRVGVLSIGDVFTTSNFTGDVAAAADNEHGALGYVSAVNGKLTVAKTEPAEAKFLGVIKAVTTMPNGDKAIKFRVARV